MDKGMVISSWVVCVGLAFLNLPFIIADLIFANLDSNCTTDPFNEFSFTLKAWLEVDGCLKLTVIGALLFFHIVSTTHIDCAHNLFIRITFMSIPYCIFNFVWLIIGSNMFWIITYKEEKCSAVFTFYMFINLIYGVLVSGGLIKCFVIYKQRKESMIV